MPTVEVTVKIRFTTETVKQQGPFNLEDERETKQTREEHIKDCLLDAVGHPDFLDIEVEELSPPEVIT